MYFVDVFVNKTYNISQRQVARRYARRLRKWGFLYRLNLSI